MPGIEGRQSQGDRCAPLPRVGIINEQIADAEEDPGVDDEHDQLQGGCFLAAQQLVNEDDRGKKDKESDQEWHDMPEAGRLKIPLQG